MAGAGGEPISCQLRISSEVAGRLIGKGGERIKAIRSETGAKLVIESDENYAGYRTARIAGSARQLFPMFEQCFSGPTAKEQDEELDIQFVLPSTRMGCIIGKGGANINAIRSECTAKIGIERTPPGHTEEWRAIDIHGTVDQLKQAVMIIIGKLEEDSPSGDWQPGMPAGGPTVAPGGGAKGGGGNGGFRWGESPKGKSGGWKGAEKGWKGSEKGWSGGMDYSDPYGGWGGAAYKGGWDSTSYKGGDYYGGKGGYDDGKGYWKGGGGGAYGGGFGGWGASAGYEKGGKGRGKDEGPPQGLLVIEMCNNLAGCIIGKGGTVINSIRKTTGGKLEVKECTRWGGGERVCCIDGEPDQVDATIVEIFQAIDSKHAGTDKGIDLGNIDVVLMVRGNHMGSLIGKGGENINQIRGSSGARVKVDSAMQGAPQREVFINGASENVREALRFIAKLFFQEGIGGGEKGGGKGYGGKDRSRSPIGRAAGW